VLYQYMRERIQHAFRPDQDQKSLTNKMEQSRSIVIQRRRAQSQEQISSLSPRSRRKQLAAGTDPPKLQNSQILHVEIYLGCQANRRLEKEEIGSEATSRYPQSARARSPDWSVRYQIT
jgi:hypothetical protein